MDFDAIFKSQLETLKSEGNYRVFAELERRCGAFPRAARHRALLRHAALQRAL